VQDRIVVVTQACHWQEVIYAYRIAPFLMTLSGLQGHSSVARRGFSSAIFRTVCSSSQNFNWHSVSCGPSATARHLVITTGWMFVNTMQPVVQPAVQLNSRLTTGCVVYTDIQPVNKPVWQPVWQQVVSCKRGFREYRIGVSSWHTDRFKAARMSCWCHRWRY